MAKGKKYRKGKKEWRKNIGTGDLDDYTEIINKDARSGGPLDAVPDNALFFVDKSKDSSVQRKVDRHRAKVLHCESILKRGSMVAPVAWPLRRKEGASAAAAKAVKRNGQAIATIESQKPVSRLKNAKRKKADLWDEKELGEVEEEEVEDAAIPPNDWLEGLKSRRVKRVATGPKQPWALTPAVQVDGPGCSYNPSFDDHQDALAEAAAAEMQKQYRKELEPPPIQIAASAAEEVLDEEDVFFLEADRDEEDGSALEDEPAPSLARPVQVRKLTQADLNRRLRRQAAERQLAVKRARQKLRADVLRLEEIQEEVQEEQQEQEQRHLRKETSRKERQASGPPRLGRHRFKPEPVQVLLTEEVTGSLRQLKGCPTLARDRFKSLQRRGLLEPRILVRRKEARKKKTVEQGSQGRRERELHEEILTIRAARQSLVKAKGKAAKAAAYSDELLPLE